MIVLCIVYNERTFTISQENFEHREGGSCRNCMQLQNKAFVE